MEKVDHRDGYSVTLRKQEFSLVIPIAVYPEKSCCASHGPKKYCLQDLHAHIYLLI